jgi:hypothetical protein
MTTRSASVAIGLVLLLPVPVSAAPDAGIKAAPGFANERVAQESFHTLPRADTLRYSERVAVSGRGTA